MNKSDKLVYAALKSASGLRRGAGSLSESTRALDTAIAALKTESAKAAGQRFFAFLQSTAVEGGGTMPLDELAALVQANLTTAAEFAFTECLPGLTSLEFRQIVPLAATPKALLAWLKARAPEGDAKGATGITMLVEESLRDRAWAVETVLAKTFVDYAPVAELPRGSVYFTVPRGSRRFTPDSILLQSALKRDKSARFLESLLRGLSGNADTIGEVAATIQADAALFSKVIDDLPHVLSRDTNGTFAPFVSALLDQLPRSGGPKRRTLCARMTKLAAGLLAVKPAHGVERALEILHELSQQLADSIPAGESDPDFCGLMYARRETPGDSERITFDGARHLVLAMEKIRDGTDPLLMLEATAANLGLVPIGVPGEYGLYDPVRHREIAGEAQTGEAVVILERGWLIERQVIERAKVKKS